MNKLECDRYGFALRWTDSQINKINLLTIMYAIPTMLVQPGKAVRFLNNIIFHNSKLFCAITLKT